MTRCISCERHTLYRVCIQFTRDAITHMRHVPLLDKFKDMPDTHVTWETPELSKTSMKGAVATIIIDRKLPNYQKRTVQAVAKDLCELIHPEDLQQGVIETYAFAESIGLGEEERECGTDKHK